MPLLRLKLDRSAVTVCCLGVLFLTPLRTTPAGAIDVAAAPSPTGQGFSCSAAYTCIAPPSDGARLIVGRAVSVRALAGSRLTVLSASTDGRPTLVLESGGFEITAGAAGAWVAISDTSLLASRAVLVVVVRGQDRLVAVRRLPPSGQVAFSTKAVAAARMLTSGEILHLGSPAKERPTPPAQQALLDATAARLQPRPAASAPVLVPRAVERASDLSSRGDTANNSTQELELNDVEVEAGCVEICAE